MLGQVPAGGTQVVDGAGAGLHAARIVREAGQLPSRQGRGLVPQQLCDILLRTKASSLIPGPVLKASHPPGTDLGSLWLRGGRVLAGLIPGCQAQGWCSAPGGGGGGCGDSGGIHQVPHQKFRGPWRQPSPQVVQGPVDKGFLVLS